MDGRGQGKRNSREAVKFETIDKSRVSLKLARTTENSDLKDY
jgi:hypothetical protein